MQNYYIDHYGDDYDLIEWYPEDGYAEDDLYDDEDYQQEEDPWQTTES